MSREGDLEAALRRSDRRNIWTLFAVTLFVGLFDYYEMGRRQGKGEAQDERRREWVDGELRELQGEARDNRTRKVQMQALIKTLYGLGILAATGLAAYAAIK